MRMCVVVFISTHIINPLLTKREVKKAGYWTGSFFACLWVPAPFRSIHTHTHTHTHIKGFVNKPYRLQTLFLFSRYPGQVIFTYRSQFFRVKF